MPTDINKMITIFEMNSRRIKPILNRILKLRKLSLATTKYDELLKFILSGLNPESIMDESDKILFFQITELLEKESAVDILNVSSGQTLVNKRSKFDIRHKETIRLCLKEYFDLFFPDLAKKMHFDTAQFLDKELIALFGDVNDPEQQKIADALIIIGITLDQQMEWIMIHWEAQGTKQQKFEERMFHIFSGIYYQFRKLVFPIAMFTDIHQWSTPVPNTYSMKIMNYSIIKKFSYQLIKLKKYNSEEFIKIAPQNPLTWAYLPFTNYSKDQRPIIKAKSVNGIIKTVSNEKQKATLYSLIDHSLQLNKEENDRYLDLIEKDILYKETKMLESIEEVGIEKGRKEERFSILSKLIKSGMLTIDQIVQATGEQYDYIKNIDNQINNKISFIQAYKE